MGKLEQILAEILPSVSFLEYETKVFPVYTFLTFFYRV